MPIWNFHHIGKEIDYRYLVKADYVEEVTYLPINAPEIWNNIFNEYCEISDNYESQLFLQNTAEYETLKLVKAVCNSLLFNLMHPLPAEVEEEYFKELSAHGFSFNKSKPAQELKRAEVWLKSMNVNINRLKNKLDDHRKKVTHPKRLEEQLVKLERVTKRNEINPKTTSVTKFLYIIKDAETMTKKKAA